MRWATGSRRLRSCRKVGRLVSNAMGNSSSTEDSNSVSFNSIVPSSSGSSSHDEYLRNVGDIGYVNPVVSKEFTRALENLIKESTRPLQVALRGLNARVILVEGEVRRLLHQGHQRAPKENEQDPKEEANERERDAGLEGATNLPPLGPAWRVMHALMRRVAQLESAVIELNSTVRHSQTLQWATSQAVSNMQRTAARRAAHNAAPPPGGIPSDDSGPSSRSDPSWHSDPSLHADSGAPSFHSDPASRSDPSSKDRPPSPSDPKGPLLPPNSSSGQDTNATPLPPEPSSDRDINNPNLSSEPSSGHNTNASIFHSEISLGQNTNVPILPSEPSSGQGTNAPILPSEPSSGQGTNAPILPSETSSGQGTNAPVLSSEPSTGKASDAPILPSGPSSGTNVPILPSEPLLVHGINITDTANVSILVSHNTLAISTANGSMPTPADTSSATAREPQAFNVSSVVSPNATVMIPCTSNVGETSLEITSTTFGVPSPSVPLYIVPRFRRPLASVHNSTVLWPSPLATSQSPSVSSTIPSSEVCPQAVTSGEISAPTHSIDSSCLISKDPTSVIVSETYPSVFRYASAFAMGNVPFVGAHRPTFFSLAPFTTSRVSSIAPTTPSGPSTSTSIPSALVETRDHPNTTGDEPSVAKPSVVPPQPTTSSHIKTSTSVPTTHDEIPKSSNTSCGTSTGNLPVTTPSTMPSDTGSASSVPSSTQPSTSVPATSANFIFYYTGAPASSIVHNATPELPAILTYRHPSTFTDPTSIWTPSVITVYNERPAKVKLIRPVTVPRSRAQTSGEERGAFSSPEPGASSVASAPAAMLGSLREVDRALLEAAALGDARAICRHLDAGADIRASNPAGHNALHMAAFAGSAYCIFVLLNRGAYVNATSATGWTALHCAAASSAAPPPGTAAGQNDQERLPSPSPPPAPAAADEEEDGVGLQSRAAKCLELLLSEGASPLRQDRSGCTALHVAAYYADASAVRVLLKAGASVHRRDARRRTPAQIARSEVVHAMLSQWAARRAW